MGLPSEEIVHTEAANQEWVHGFLAALKQGNMNQILSMLDQDVVLVSDGGGKVQAAINPIETRDRVARFLLGPIRQAATMEGEGVIEIVQINGQPGIILRSSEGIHTVVMLHTEGNLIRNLYVVRNPDKLEHVSKERK
jgi:RNA polymerase sigma-70 factor (ECF subfamily)